MPHQGCPCNVMLTEKIKTWYGKYERPVSSLSLIGGFVFDAITLKRVDLFWENFWVIARLAIVGTCIVLVHAMEKSEGDVVVGGRDGGFRTYSEKTLGLTPGHWRVNVLTTRGQVIGSVRFNLVMATALPKVTQKINE